MRSLDAFERLMPAATTATSHQMSETDVEFKSKLFAKNVTETIHNIANEPSVGFYRIEEHVHRSIQGLLSKKSEIDLMNDKLQGIHFDLDYSIDTVVNMYKTRPIFDSINDLITDSMFAARQINLKSDFASASSSPKAPAKQPQASTPAKKESIFSGILSSTTKPFRTSSISITENLSNNAESRMPQRSQTMLLSSPTTTTVETVKPPPIHEDD